MYQKKLTDEEHMFECLHIISAPNNPIDKRIYLSCIVTLLHI